jgi:hypothetical protein
MSCICDEDRLIIHGQECGIIELTSTSSGSFKRGSHWPGRRTDAVSIHPPDDHGNHLRNPVRVGRCERKEAALLLGPFHPRLGALFQSVIITHWMQS